MKTEARRDGLGKWTAFEKWTVGLAVALVVFLILGGNTSSQAEGAIYALGSLALLAWLFTIPLGLFFIGVHAWTHWAARQRKEQ